MDKIKEDHVYKLQFDGVYENSTVWVNGKVAGGQKFGYSRFTLDISDLIHEGDNLIQVKVDNTSFPADRWYSGAGIYRTVELLELYRHHLQPENIYVTTAIEGETGVVAIHTGLSSLVHATLSNDSGIIAGASDNGVISLEVPDVKLWSPDEPNLYQLELTLLEENKSVDQYGLKIGFRDIQMIPDKGMYINGKVTKIKGLCVHQDAGCLGTAVTPEIWKDRLIRFKEIGCNAIRTSHHIFASEILDLCDELGLLVYEEPFDKWTEGSYGCHEPAFQV